MTIYKFPSEIAWVREPKKEKKRGSANPEFIDIEDLHNQANDEGLFGTFEELRQSNSMPFVFRVFSFFVSFVLFATSSLLLVLSAITGVLSGLTLGKVSFIEKRFHKYWRNFKRLFTLGLGLQIMTFSPSLGMSFILIYVSLQGESMEGSFIKSFLAKYH